MRVLVQGLVVTFAVACSAAALADDEGSQRHLVLGGSKYLADGAAAIRSGDYDEGIRLNLLGLERDALAPFDRAAGLANLCAAHVAKDEPDAAIPYCDESLRINGRNWKAYSNRSHAYLLKGRYAEARLDNDAAAAISRNAPHVRMIAEALNELTLRPRITIEEHP